MTCSIVTFIFNEIKPPAKQIVIKTCRLCQKKETIRFNEHAGFYVPIHITPIESIVSLSELVNIDPVKEILRHRLL